MQRPSPTPTHAAATGRRATHSEKTGISECIMMTRSWTTPTRVIVVVRRRKPLAGKRNFACIIMRRFWTTPSIIMLRCDPGLGRGSLEARTGGPVLWEQGASFEASAAGAPQDEGGGDVRPSRLSPSGFAPQDEGVGVRGSERMKTPPHAEKLVTPAMVVVGLVLATVPLWITRVGLYPYLGVEILIWSLYALAFNLLLGTAGLPSFGHGAYFGVGAYAFGLFGLNVAPNLWLCLAAALAAGAAAGALVSLFISHRRGIYYAFMTIAFGQIFWFVAVKSHGITGGEDGLLKIARPPADLGLAAFDLTSNTALYYFVLVVFMAAVVGLWRLTHSPFGRVLSAIRQSETRAAHLGYRVRLYKMAVFTISAALSGLAGGLFAMAQNSAFPDVMSLHYSGIIVMMVLIGGGMVSFWGPVSASSSISSPATSSAR